MSNVVSEIEQVRSRMVGSDWDNGIAKLLFLYRTVSALEQESESQSYFIVACIAAIETHFKWQIRTLIDSDEGYSKNLRLEDLSIKLSLDLAEALHGKRITVGELVAYSATFSSLGSITSTMKRILGTDFVELVKSVRHPGSDGLEAEPIMHPLGETLLNVTRAFELRHVICHEAPIFPVATLGEIQNLCLSCYHLALASYYGIARLRNPNVTSNLSDAINMASERLRALKDKIKALEDRVCSHFSTVEQEMFVAMQDAWREYVQTEAGFFASLQMNGNRCAYDEIVACEAGYKERIRELEEWLQGTEQSDFRVNLGMPHSNRLQ